MALFRVKEKEFDDLKSRVQSQMHQLIEKDEQIVQMRVKLEQNQKQLDEQCRINADVQSSNLKLMSAKSFAESEARLASHYKQELASVE